MEERRRYTFTPAHQRHKQRQMEETGRVRYMPDERLPPISFQTDARNLNRYNRQKRLQRIKNKHKNDEVQQVKAKLMKSITSQRLRDAIAGKEYDSDEEREKKPGAKATRAIDDLFKYFPNVLAIDGAPHGRIDLSKDGARFGTAKRTDKNTAPRNKLKAAAYSSISTRSLLGRHL